MPRRDEVAEWRTAGEKLDADRAAAKRGREQERTADAAAAALSSAAEWAAWVTARIKEERDFLIEVCGGAIGELTENLRDEFEAKVGELKRDFARERDAYQRDMHRVELESKALRELHFKELARATNRVAALERSFDNLNTALNAKRADQKADNLSENIDAARRDIAALKLKMN